MRYSPILRGDPTCLVALARTEPRPDLRPILVLDNEDLAQMPARAQRLRFTGHVIGIDVRSERRSDILMAFADTIAPLIDAGARCNPVFAIDDGPAVLRHLGAWALDTGNDLIARLRAFPIGARERLQQAMVLATTATRLPRQRIHLILDQADDLSSWASRQLVPMIADNGPWGSITIAAGSAQPITSINRRGEWIRVERRELEIRRELTDLGSIGSPLGLGDFANRHPLLEAGLTHARGNGMRWSVNTAWHVLREHASCDHAKRRSLIRELVGLDALDLDHPRSWGERSLGRYLEERAEFDQINAWMVNHHLELAASASVPQPALGTLAPAE